MSGPAAVQPLALPDMAKEAVKAALAHVVSQAGGSGTPADVRLVRAELMKMPVGALQIMNNNGTKVVACRGNINTLLREGKICF